LPATKIGSEWPFPGNFRRQNGAWSAHDLPGEIVEVTDCHHYAVLEQLAQPDGVLAKALAVAAGTDPD